jgi:flagellar biosynthetic protein FliR
VPSPAKILFALTLSLMIFPVISYQGLDAAVLSEQIIWLTLKEIFVGLSLGFIARMFFFAVGMAGEVIAVSMGLASAQLFNPSLGGRSTPLEQTHLVLATLFFLAIQGHHLFLMGVVDSFRLFPLTAMGVDLSTFSQMGVLLQEVTEIAVRISAPVMISILFMNIAMAVIGRAVPQINVLITSLPVNILVGFAVLTMTVPLFVWELESVLEATSVRLFQMLKAF